MSAATLMPMTNTDDTTELRAILREALRLQDQQMSLSLEWRAAIALGDGARADELNSQLRALTESFDQLIAGVDLGDEPPAVDRRSITSV